VYVLQEVEPDNIDAKIEVLRKILSKEKLTDYREQFTDIINSVNTKESADSKLFVLDKLLNDNLELNASEILDVVTQVNEKNASNVLCNIETYSRSTTIVTSGNGIITVFS